MSARTRFSATALRALRKRARLSRDLLAYGVGLTTGTIANYEQGRTVPSAEVVARLAACLDCQVEDLFEEIAAHVALSRETLVPQIIDQEQFDAVQEALSRTTTIRNRENDRVYPLSLRLFGHCGEPYAGTYRKELGRRYYMCRNKNYENRSIRCDDRAIRADDVEAVVWEQVCELLSKPERLLELAEQ